MDWLHRDHGLSHPSQQKMLNKAANQCGSYFHIRFHSENECLLGIRSILQVRQKSFAIAMVTNQLQLLSITPWQSNLASFRCLKTFMFQWIGLRENLQETIVFTIKYRAFL
jgi:hypothetical protein